VLILLFHIRTQLKNYTDGTPQSSSQRINSRYWSYR